MEPQDKIPVTKGSNDSQTRLQNRDFPNIPAATEPANPPKVDKEDISESSEINQTGKTDNTETSAGKS